ncbi:MAG: patatin-like phospholipase family protein [Verrucomicrobia bacterium]|nr:patatin-like phospholipase family protein [Verrucomicrobiota bacterium]
MDGADLVELASGRKGLDAGAEKGETLELAIVNASIAGTPLRIAVGGEFQSMSTFRRTRYAMNLSVLFLMSAVVSAQAEQRTPYTEAELEKAVPMGIPGVRAWGDAPLSVLKTQMANLGPLLTGQPISMLALSGGGEHGAFGAGLLSGWSESGHRPTFDIVTGVSTGALMSPFAFLGSKYDDRLKALYTQMTFHSVFSGNPFLGLFGQGLYSTAPLQRVVASQVDQKLLADIATAYREGRRLFVITTNLDAQRPVLWNMGALAASGHPQALELFRKVLVASASVAGAFDPVYIDAEANGHHFKEMHVDGGTAYPLFAVPVRLLAATGQGGEHNGGQIYIVINNNLDPDFAVTKPKTFNIAARAFNTLVKSSFYDTILNSYIFAKDEGYTFNLAYIPNSFGVKSVGLVDQKYMLALFDLGQAQGVEGGEWQHTPPRLYK